MNDKEELLAKNIKEFYVEGNYALDRCSYNTATSLYFKAIAVLADWFVLREEKFIPKSHADRFRILEQKHPEIYSILDKDFPVYQDSYKLSLTKQQAMVLKDDLRKFAQKIGFKLD